MDARIGGLACLAMLVVVGCTQGGGCPSCPTRDTGRSADADRVDAGSAPDASTPLDAARPDTGATGVDAGDVDAAALACDGAMVTLPDPTAVDGDETQPSSCTGCPSFTSLTVTPGTTTASIHGTVTGATSCSWTLVSPSCGGTTGAFGPDPEFGMFSITLPLFCGTNRLQLTCTNASGTAIATRTISGPSCGSRDVQVTLAWGATSNDQELHLVREGAVINDMVGDCTWFTCVSTSPDWGVVGDPTDDPHKDVDWLSTFGPENIYLAHAANGRYEVMVEYWGSGTTDAPSVTVTLGGRTVWMGSHTMSLHDVWDVGTIVFPGPTFVPVDTVVPCEAQWHGGGSRGCALPIP